MEDHKEVKGLFPLDLFVSKFGAFFSDVDWEVNETV